MWALLLKDLKNLKNTYVPALLMSLPLILILGMSSNEPSTDLVSWRSAFWLIYFISTSALFYRSFEQENRSRNYSLYFSLRLPRWMIFLSQSFVQFFAASLLALSLFIFIQIFWSPSDFSWQPFGWASLVSLSLAPLGCLLSLLLRLERDFLFALFYVPISSPALLAGYQLSLGYQQAWFYSLLIFCVLSLFLSSLLFEFFFDELAEND